MDRYQAHQKFQAILKKHDHSYTNVRKTVFDALFGREPQTMSEIIERIGSAADRASIYRTVEVLESIGIIQRLNIGWKYKLELSDLFSDHHHHLNCVNCGKVISITEAPQFEQDIEKISHKNGFKPLSHQLEIKGLCLDCQKKELSTKISTANR